MRYSTKLNMRPAQIGAEVIERTVPPLWVPQPFTHAPVWARMGQPFNLEHFLCAHLPVQVGRLEGGVSEHEGPRAYLRVPIKVAGGNTVQIPTEMTPILDLIEHALKTFAAWYPAWESRHVHVTW